MKSGFGEVDEGEGSEIWRDEISGERGSCLIIIGGSGSKSLRGWRILQTLKTLILLETSHAGGFVL